MLIVLKFLTKVCDFEKNCPYGEDESHCGTTDFETDMGGWQDVSDTLYGWSRINGSGAQYPNCTSPGSDHTTGLPQGFYMWAPAKMSGKVNDWGKGSLRFIIYPHHHHYDYH